MHIVLTALDSGLFSAWQASCGDLDGVSLHEGSILEVECDAVVSPANSFGFMDGGIDLVYTRHFGAKVQKRLQEQIRTRHHGELIVGTAEIVETGNRRIPYLIAAPTMQVPMLLDKGVNAYLAARAALLLALHGMFPTGVGTGTPIRDVVRTVAFPGLATGVGGIPPDVCARQVRAAIEEVVQGQASFPRTWADAQERHQRLYTNTTRDLQYDPRDWKADVAQAVHRAERHRKRLDRFRTRLRKKHGL